jgi:hypothetical protein
LVKFNGREVSENECMARRKIDPSEGIAAVRAVAASADQRVNSNLQFATAVRYLLESLAELRPGQSVEVRVPPLGAVQCIEGVTHRRGTPPNVVELDPQTWFPLAVGEIDWDAATSSHRVHASGSRADLSEALPVMRLN